MVSASEVRNFLDRCPNETKVLIQWSRKGEGWGEMVVAITDTEVTVDTEGRSVGFLERTLSEVLEKVKSAKTGE